jgi:hypothetical protein
MAKPKKRVKKQKLSPAAAKAKAARDKKRAMRKDYDHKKKKFVTVKKNRGNYGKGTKKEKRR